MNIKEVNKNYEFKEINIKDSSISYAIFHNTIYYCFRDVLKLTDFSLSGTNSVLKRYVDEKFIIKIKSKNYVSSYGLENIYKKINDKEIVKTLKANQIDMRKERKAVVTLNENDEIVIDNSRELELLKKISLQNEQILNKQENHHKENQESMENIVKQNNFIINLLNWVKEKFSKNNKITTIFNKKAS